MLLIESNMESCVLTALMPQIWTGPGVYKWLRANKIYGRIEYMHFCLCCVYFMCVGTSVGVSQQASHPTSHSLCAWGGSLPAGWSRCLVTLSHPLDLPLMLPSRLAQSTATCYQINISPHWRQHVIPPLRGQRTHCQAASGTVPTGLVYGQNHNAEYLSATLDLRINMFNLKEKNKMH